MSRGSRAAGAPGARRQRPRRRQPVVWLLSLLAPLVAAWSSSAPRAAYAEERADTVSFEAPAGCPAADAFVAKVGERGGRAARVVKEPDARKARYRVRVARSGRGFRGTLSIVDGAGWNERAVDGGTCVEVVDALALVTAMALEAPPEPEASASAPASAPEAAPASASVAPAASSAPAASAAPSTGPEDGGAARLPPPTKRGVPSDTLPLRWAVGGDFALVGLDGAPPLGGELYVEAAGGTSPRSPRVAPAVRVELLGLWARRDVTSGGSLGLRWTALGVDACAVRALGGSLRVDACASVQLGALHASPSGVQAPSNALRLWLALGGALRAQLDVGAGFYLEGSGGLLAPVTRDRFSLGPGGAEVYRAAAVTLLGGLGVGVRFP